MSFVSSKSPLFSAHQGQIYFSVHRNFAELRSPHLCGTDPGRTRGPVYVHQCWAMREPLQQLLSDCEYDLERVRSPATLPIGCGWEGVWSVLLWALG